MRQLPNLVTCIRILLTPWIVITLITGDCLRALQLSWIAGSTDFLDGLLARRMGGVSRTGAYLDPIADKILLTSLFLCFGFANLVPSWLVWLVVGRDLLILTMAGLGLLFTAVRDYPPSLSGKLCTALQILTALVIMTRCAFPDRVGTGAASAMVWATTAVTVWSGLTYVWRAILTLRRGSPATV